MDNDTTVSVEHLCRSRGVNDVCVRSVARTVSRRLGAFMIWLRLVVSLMNFATLLSYWMLWCHARGSRGSSLLPTVRMLSKNGCIARSSVVEPVSQWPPLVLQLTNTGRHSTTWCLLSNTRQMSARSGNPGVVCGPDLKITCTLSFQEQASEQQNGDE